MLDFPAEIPTALENIEIRESESETIKLQDSIFSALQALEPSRRQLVIAAYIHGESRHRLSELYGVPVNTIKTWIRRALLEVRAQIGVMPASHDDVDLLSRPLAYYRKRGLDLSSPPCDAPAKLCDLTSMLHDVRISLQCGMPKLMAMLPNSGCKETKMLA